MSITAKMVKELRDVSGAGMMDAKKALIETSGDMEAAIDWLRTKGLATAAKKSGRTAAEGLVGVATEGSVGVAVEVNAETDFVGKNADFQAMVASITKAALKCQNVEELLAASIDGSTVSEIVTNKIATIGENMSVRRMGRIEAETVAAYVHNATAPDMGKIGVLVGMTGADNGIGKQIAMHIAATNPASLSEADLDAALVEREKKVLTEQARESGKPENIIENMIKGRMQKFYKEVTLLNQQFVINPDITVAQAAKDAGVEVTGYVRLEVGEGIEKVEEDFAAEVAKTMGG